MRLLISLAFGNNLALFHWDISIAFTNANANGFLSLFQKDYNRLFSGYKAGTMARLKRNLYGSETE